MVSAGWALDLPVLQRLHPRLVSMKLNTAMSLVLVGLALRGCVAPQWRDRVIRALALTAAAIAAVTLSEYVSGFNLGIDELLCRDPSTAGAPGRMSPITAVCLLLLGMTLAWRESRWAPWTALLTLLCAHVAVLGYLYGVSDLYTIRPFGSVAVHTAVALYLLAAGSLLARPSQGYMRLLASDSPGGTLARRLLPAAFLAPALLGLLRLWGQQAGLYSTEFGLAMFAASNTICFTFLIWWSAANLTRASAELVQGNERLRTLASASDAFGRVATNSQTLLDQVARIATGHIGDGCNVTLLSEDGEHLMNVANAHRDASLAADYRAYLSTIAVVKATSTSISAVVARTGEPKWGDVLPSALVVQSDEALRPLVARLNVHGFAVVPIRARQIIIGTLSLVRSAPGRSYTREDITLLQDLADRAGLALESARLYEQLEQRVRTRTQELETTNQQLSTANRSLELANEGLEAFSYSVSHDVRAPLRAVNRFSEILLTDHASALDSDGRDYVQRIQASARRATTIVDDLLALSRVSHAELRKASIDLTEIAHHVVAELRRRSPARPVEVSVADGMVTVGDGRLVTIALENILANAWKFTGKRTDPTIVVGREADGVFFVRDNGAGFDMATSTRLFEPFGRLHTDAEFEGTGIGLAIVRRIVERHGGRVWASGAVDRGATIRFTLATDSSS